MTTMAMQISRSQGVLALYNGISASLLRQLTYSMSRFAAYNQLKESSGVPERDLPFYKRVLFAGVSGFAGGIIGTPADLVNVRMQNDIKLPKEQRRNYKHAGDGLYRILREEGAPRLFSGVIMASSRAVLMTIGQLSCYDQVKGMLIASGVFGENIVTHFSASFIAGGIATAITQPFDVAKTRMMNAPPGHYASILSCFVDISRNGVSGFFKGFVPAFVRLGPQTILTFVFLEQLRLHCGYIKSSQS